MLNAALNGELKDVPVERHPVFGVAVPEILSRDVPATFLDARGMWADKAAYDRAGARLGRPLQQELREILRREPGNRRRRSRDVNIGPCALPPISR